MSGPVVPRNVYFLIFGLLMVLTSITVAVAFVNLGTLNVFVALTIAIVKALLVILFFMHVRYSSRLTKLFVSAGIFWFLILIAFTVSDYATRGW